jgi:hypothetical protein
LRSSEVSLRVSDWALNSDRIFNTVLDHGHSGGRTDPSMVTLDEDQRSTFSKGDRIEILIHVMTDRIDHRGKAGETGKRNRSGVDRGGPGRQSIDLDQVEVGDGIDIASSAYRNEGDVAVERVEWDQLHRTLRVESVSSRDVALLSSFGRIISNIDDIYVVEYVLHWALAPLPCALRTDRPPADLTSISWSKRYKICFSPLIISPCLNN